ncbi:MAG: type II toxin-antitoxin system VapC family toxin [Pyrinomonadaceae bacterium]
MILLDSNTIIYFASPGFADHRMEYAKYDLAASAVSRIEVLGYHSLEGNQEKDFEDYFASIVVLEMTSEVVERAIWLRQQRKIGLGDAIVAATGLVHDLTLATRNTKDFKWITSLTLIDPFEDLAQSQD